MKEIELKNDTKIEVSVKQKKQVEHKLIGNIVPHEGHIIWEINTETMEIDKAKFSNATYHFGGENKKEIIRKEGFEYVSAFNKKNALRKYNQGKNGSKNIDQNPLSINNHG